MDKDSIIVSMDKDSIRVSMDKVSIRVSMDKSENFLNLLKNLNEWPRSSGVHTMPHNNPTINLISWIGSLSIERHFAPTCYQGRITALPMPGLLLNAENTFNMPVKRRNDFNNSSQNLSSTFYVDHALK